MHRLPIDEQKSEILAALKDHATLVIEAEPGAGKTTRVPIFIAEAMPAQTWILEPRRLAAKLAAEQIARSLREPIGGRVGYQFRFDSNFSARTEILFLTEGLFLRRLLSNPTLQGVSTVILDEFHERHVHTDVALTWVRWLQNQVRPGLKLILMSATLDQEKTEAALGKAKWIKAPGRRFPLAIKYPSFRADQRELEDRVAAVIREAAGERPDPESRNDILVFLPGTGEIRAVERRLQTRPVGDARILPLYGDLSKEEQNEVLRASGPRRVILATNIAESSVTIDGVSIVIDAGLVRRAEESDSGFSVLRVRGISQSSAIQRANRAGRQGPGICYRIFSAEEYARKPVQEAAEIQRLEISEWVLYLHALLKRVGGKEIAWYESPPAATLAQTTALLKQLGALADDTGEITAVGEKMVETGLAPRLAKILIEAEAGGVGDLGCRLGALFAEDFLPEGDIADFLADLTPERERRFGHRYLKVKENLEKNFGRAGAPAAKRQAALMRAVFLGFPDRVAKVRGLKAEGCNGEVLDKAQTQLHDDGKSPYVIVLARHQKKLLSWIPIDESLLLEESHGLFSESRELVWDATKKTLSPRSIVRYGKLTLWEEDQSRDQWRAECAETLAAKLLGDADGDWEKYRDICDPEELKPWLLRLRLYSQKDPTFRYSARAGFLRYCESIQAWSLRELSEGGFLAFLQAELDPKIAAWLEREVPVSIQLNPKRRARINYEENQPPWIESRLQDFFGMKKAPILAEGRVKLTLRLLAPNMRPVQVTQDLESFWKNTYPQVRQELSRRYPRHAWPENPL